MLTKNEMLTMLKTEAVPAFGCTEPVCVSLAAADAAKNAGGDVLSVEIEVNPNIFKNGMSVGIPGFDKVGLDYAAALGAMLKNPEKQLQLLQDITDEVKDGANKLVKNGKVKVDIKADEMKLYVKCKVETNNGESITTIRDAHTAIVSRVVNGKEIFNAASQSGKAGRACRAGRAAGEPGLAISKRQKRADAERRPFFSILSHFRATPMTAARPPAIVPMQERYAPTPMTISPEMTPISALSR